MKRVRQKAILDLVRTREIASQEELLESLLARRIDVSQSTLSRDIQELGLAKSGGVYIAGVEPPKSSDDAIRRTLREFMTDVAVAQNIVVLKSGPGHASTISRAIDESGWEEIVGTLAGDDTVFVALRSARDSRRVADRIREYIQ